MSRQDGGPAFPCDPDIARSCHGMSLRDWFAGQALAGLSSNPEFRDADVYSIARWSWASADAMLAAREAGDE